MKSVRGAVAGVILAVSLMTCLMTGLMTWAGTEVSDSSAFQEAWELYEKGTPDAALFQKVLEDDFSTRKDRFNSAYLLAVMALEKRDAKTALGYLDRADDAKSGRPQVAIRRAEAHLIQEDFKKAGKILKSVKSKSLRKNPVLQVKHQIAFAKAEHGLGATERAISRLEKFARKQKKSWQVYFTVGTLYEGLDQPAQAMKAYERVIELDPKKDPFAGIYAYQRWAALTISSDMGSYGKKSTIKPAVERYKIFLARAEANGVPSTLVKTVEQAVWALENFAGG